MPKDLPNILTEKTQVSFAVPRLGLYAISITARCEGKNDLRVEIDGQLFREVPAKDNIQKYDVPPAWNGSKLQGLKQTNIFLIKLDKGDHIITFFPEGQARVEEWTQWRIEDSSNLVFDLNRQTEAGDKRPWFTFILVDLPLVSITAEASTSWHLFDGDDVKLIVDNEIEHNPDSKLWRDWIWHATPGQIFSGPKKEVKAFSKNLSSGIHYIEFWVDKTPTLHIIVLDLGELVTKEPSVETDQPQSRIPTVDDPKWTGNFEDDTEVMILARLILGEAENQSEEARLWVAGSVLNRVTAKAWPDTIHKVIAQSGQYDPFKVVDNNFAKITDPLNEDTSQLRLKNWQECYRLAKKLLSGKIENPTTATHFNGKGIDREAFMDKYIPNGEFLRQIDDTYFYWSPN